MNIFCKRFCDWDLSFRKKLRYASYGSFGLMTTIVYNNPETTTYVAMKHNFLGMYQILGWLIIGDIPVGKAAMLYTNKSFRKLGVAEKLILESSKNIKEDIYVMPHDYPSRQFFSKMKEKVPNIKISNHDSYSRDLKIKLGNDHNMTGDITLDWTATDWKAFNQSHS